jgi:hypothetical protein
MTGWWLTDAGRLQEENRKSEDAKGDTYTDDVIGRSTVYTREDLSLVVGLLIAFNRQVFTVKVFLAIITAIAAYIAIRV